MISIHELQRRLRLPAPDEPLVLPALVLPIAGNRVGRSGRTIGAGRSVRALGFGSPRLAMAVLLLLAVLVAAIATGALRVERLLSIFGPSDVFTGDGIVISYPKGWVRLTDDDPFNQTGANTVLILTNRDDAGCTPGAVGEWTQPTPFPSMTDGVFVVPPTEGGTITNLEDRILACLIRQAMEEGEIRIAVTQGMPQAIGIGPIGDFDPAVLYDGGENPEFAFYIPTDADGWTERVDGMPAKLVVATDSVTPEADEVRTWIVTTPGGGIGPWYIQAVLRGPDLDGLRRQADAIAASLRFDHHPPPLDEATRDEALARTLDAIDRETRQWQGSDLFGCFPRSPGSVEATIDDILYQGSPGGRLAEPLPVTCTTTVEATPFGLWYAEFVLSWDAGDGWPAGRWGWYAGFDADGGALGSQGQLFWSEELVPPGVVGELPAPLDAPLDIPIGSIVEVLPPGILQATPDGALQAYFRDPHPEIGDRLAIDVLPGERFGVVGGPVSHVGLDWYLVELRNGSAYPSEFVWLPSTDGVRPLVRVVEPTCAGTSPTVVELLASEPAEWLACYGDTELTIDPATAVLAADEGGWGTIEGTPDWLARLTLWRLYGAGGPDGVDGWLPFAIWPDLGEAIPAGTWLTVTGHFDDPAAAQCVRDDAGGGWPVEPEIVRVSCRELFVVTAIEGRGAP